MADHNREYRIVMNDEMAQDIVSLISMLEDQIVFPKLRDRLTNIRTQVEIQRARFATDELDVVE